MTALPNQQPIPVAAPTAGANPARIEGRAKRTNVLVWAILLVGLVLVVAPFVWMVLGSFKPQGEFLRVPPTWLPEQPTLDNYQRLFDRLDFPRFFFNSVVVAAAVTIGNLIFAPMLGWALAKLRWRGKGFVMGLVLATLMLPAGATLIPLFILMSSLGLVNTYPGLILPFVAGPLGVFLTRQYFLGIPDELIEAARIDGAGEFRIFRQIAFRLLGPGFVTVLLFTFVATWNNYFLPLVMLSEPRWYPLTVGLAQWNAEATAGGGATAAFNTVITGALISIIPLIIAFIFLQRYWQSGLAAGSVKG